MFTDASFPSSSEEFATAQIWVTALNHQAVEIYHHNAIQRGVSASCCNISYWPGNVTFWAVVEDMPPIVWPIFFLDLPTHSPKWIYQKTLLLTFQFEQQRFTLLVSEVWVSSPRPSGKNRCMHTYKLVNPLVRGMTLGQQLYRWFWDNVLHSKQ